LNSLDQNCFLDPQPSISSTLPFHLYFFPHPSTIFVSSISQYYSFILQLISASLNISVITKGKYRSASLNICLIIKGKDRDLHRCWFQREKITSARCESGDAKKKEKVMGK
jgi:hypothetical protein